MLNWSFSCWTLRIMRRVTSEEVGKELGVSGARAYSRKEFIVGGRVRGGIAG